MPASSAPATLAAADGATRLPRLGGMARPNGVAIVSERFWAFADVDGGLREGTMPSIPRWCTRLPLLRGLVRLSLALSPLLRRTGAARRVDRFLLVGALVLPLGLAFLPADSALAAGLVLTAGLLFLLLRGRTLSLHGAEHRAIAAAERRELVASWAGAARPSRFSPRCGTNFAALVFPVALVAERVWPFPVALWTPLAVVALSLALTMELWQVVQASSGRLARAFLLPGLGLQRVTTREPRLEETQVALRAVDSVLSRELEHPQS